VKLVHKLFTASVLTSMVIVVTLVVVMPYLASRHFADYLTKVQMEQLSNLVGMLENEYENHHGWSHFEKKPYLWEQMLDQSKTSLGPGLWPPIPPNKDPLEDKGTLHPLSPPLFSPPPPPRPYPGILHRLSLFDDQKRLVAGAAFPPDKLDLREIVSNGQKVGWLGFNRPSLSEDPLRIHFVYQQIKILVLIGLATMILAALMAFVLSRHLLKPIQQLSQGAHALASRRFETRIDARSSDELGELASDFNKMANTLERYEYMRRQWISDVSHELRTPLAVLRGEVEAVLDGVRDIRRETLESLHTEIMLLTKIVNDLHALTIIESEGLSMARSPVNIMQTTADILGAYRASFWEQNIELINELPESAVITVRGDADRLSQVFSNIFENTLRYTDSPGKVRIRHNVKNGDLSLFIEDSAPGVAESALPFIFDRLYRADSSRSRTKGGSGLGLAICKAIIETIGGHITANRSSLGGLQIEITLPICKNI